MTDKLNVERLRGLHEAAKWQEPTGGSAREFGLACARHDQARAEKALYLEQNTPAILAMAEENKELRERLGFWAARQTCEDALADTSPAPWRDCSPEQRLAIIAARKELHDGEVLKARRALGKDQA